MPKIPMAGDPGIGLGEARYQRSVETPLRGRPIPKEVGPKLEVNKLDVVERKAAPLSQIKPVGPNINEGDPIIHGLDVISQRAFQFAAVQQEELRKVNEAKEKTALLVSMGDQKSAYRTSTLDIINNPEMPLEDKATELQKLEDDFRATIQEAKPQYQPVVASEVMSTIGSVKQHAQDVFLKNQQDGIKADLETRANQLTLDAASSGDLDGALAHFDALQGAYKSAGMTDAHFINDRLKFEQGVLQNDIMGQLKSVDYKAGAPALEAVNGLLARLSEVDDQNVPKNWTRLAPSTRNADIAAVLQKKNQIEADMLAGANKELTAMNNMLTVAIDNYRMAKKNGYPIDAKSYVAMNQLAQSVIAMDPDKSKGYMALNSIRRIEDEYNFAYDIEQKIKNPFHGTPVRPFGPEIFSSPDALAGAIQDRMVIGRFLKQKNGLIYTPFLTGDEAKAFADLGAKDPATLINLVKPFSETLGDDKKKSLEFMASQIGVQGGADAGPAAYIVASIAKGDLNSANSLAEGVKVMKDPSFIMPPPAQLKNLFQARIGSALTESTLNSGLLFKQFEAAYAKEASKGNLNKGDPDNTTADKAFKMIAGSVISMNGSSVLLPKDMPENKFLDWKQSLTPETVQIMGGIKNMSNEKAVDFIRYDARWKAVADGVYVLEHAGQIVQNKTGQKFYLDVNTPILNPKERPDIEPLVQRMSQMNQDATLLGK